MEGDPLLRNEDLQRRPCLRADVDCQGHRPGTPGTGLGLAATWDVSGKPEP